MKKIRNILATLSILPILYFTGCSGGQQGDDGNSSKAINSSTTFAYVTNGVDPFWDLCAAGVRIAEQEFELNVRYLCLPREWLIKRE